MKKQPKIKFHPTSLNTSKSIASSLFLSFPDPEDVIASLYSFIYKKGASLPFSEYDEVAQNIWIHKSAYLSSSVKIDAPAIICQGASICHGAHIKGSIVGSFAYVGDNSFVSGSIILDSARLNFSNVVCSSIIGNGACLSSGASVCEEKEESPYAHKKCGAIICDYARIGSNSVINTGVVVDEYATVPPLCTVIKYVKPFSVYKKK